MSSLARARAPLLFGVVDCLFLALVGAAANAAMYIVHGFRWNLVLTISVGMVLAMAVQTIMALGAAPVLGSIESMVPSMVLAMSGPMLLCILERLGLQLKMGSAAGFGVASGIAAFLGFQLSGWYYRRILRRRRIEASSDYASRLG